MFFLFLVMQYLTLIDRFLSRPQIQIRAWPGRVAIGTARGILSWNSSHQRVNGARISILASFYWLMTLRWQSTSHVLAPFSAAIAVVLEAERWSVFPTDIKILAFEIDCSNRAERSLNITCSLLSRSANRSKHRGRYFKRKESWHWLWLMFRPRLYGFRKRTKIYRWRVICGLTSWWHFQRSCFRAGLPRHFLQRETGCLVLGTRVAVHDKDWHP